MTSERSGTGGDLKAIVFGAGGLLGTALVGRLPAAGFDVVASPRGRADGDIANRALVEDLLGRHRPAVVFNAAAWTDVDGAEDHQAEAHRANAEGPCTLATVCAAVGAKLIHYSTDFVYDGERETPYDESIPASPQSVYAATKLEGEQRVAAACPRSYVLRVGCLYGRGGRNFPSTLLRRLRAGEHIRADNERRVSPTWVGPVATISGQLARTQHFGLFHATASGETVWADFARAMADAIGLPSSQVEAVSGSALKLKAARPRRSILDSRHLREVGLGSTPAWQEQLRGYLDTEPEPA